MLWLPRSATWPLARRLEVITERRHKPRTGQHGLIRPLEANFIQGKDMNTDANQFKPLGQKAQAAVDKAAGSTQDAIRSTHDTAHRVLYKGADKVDEAGSQAAPAADKGVVDGQLCRGQGQGKTERRLGSVRQRAQKASDSAMDYVKDEPIRAMLIAAATAAVLMTLLKTMVGSRI